MVSTSLMAQCEQPPRWKPASTSCTCGCAFMASAIVIFGRSRQGAAQLVQLARRPLQPLLQPTDAAESQKRAQQGEDRDDQCGSCHELTPCATLARWPRSSQP